MTTELLERVQTQVSQLSLLYISQVPAQVHARPPTSSAASQATACPSPGIVMVTGTAPMAAMRRSAVSGHFLGWDL